MKAAQKDVCYFCGTEYHPQLICTLSEPLSEFSDLVKPPIIWVCEYAFKFDEQGDFVGLEPRDECKKRAESDGYELRRDLTPTR